MPDEQPAGGSGDLTLHSRKTLNKFTFSIINQIFVIQSFQWINKLRSTDFVFDGEANHHHQHHRFERWDWDMHTRRCTRMIWEKRETSNVINQEMSDGSCCQDVFTLKKRFLTAGLPCRTKLIGWVRKVNIITVQREMN